MRTLLTEDPIELGALLGRISSPSRGAVVAFLGTVRNHHCGRPVVAIDYQAYLPMAERVLRQITEELEGSEPDLRCAIVHRLGRLEVGEVSIAIVAASPHREAAFKATRTALERVKREAPIWKLEHYADGTRAWRTEEPLQPSAP